MIVIECIGGCHKKHVLMGLLFLFLFLHVVLNSGVDAATAHGEDCDTLGREEVVFRTSGRCTLGIGNVCGEYRLVKRIGGGAHGRVFRCENTSTREKVIVKAIHKTYFRISDPHNEVRILRMLHHPDIKRAIDWFEAGDYKFIVFGDDNAVDAHEFMWMLRADGVSLGVDAIRLFGACLLNMIEYLRSRHVLNNDLKLANLLVDMDSGRIMMIDFGISRVLDRIDDRCGDVRLKKNDLYLFGRTMREIEEIMGFMDERLERLINRLSDDKNGRMDATVGAVMEDPFFRGVDWDAVRGHGACPFRREVALLRRIRSE